MTIAATATSQQYVRNGTTTQWSYPNKIFSASDLTVVDLDTSSPPVVTTLVLGTDYTVQNVDVDTGCTVTTTVAGIAGHTLDIRSNIAQLQSTSIKNQGSFLPELHEEFFDRITREVQDLKRLTYTFGLHAGDTEATPWTALPAAKTRANTGLIFDSNGLPAVGVIPSTVLTQLIFNSFLTAAPTGGSQTPTELAAGITPSNLAFSPGSLYRYGAKGGAGRTSDAVIASAVLTSASGGFAGAQPGMVAVIVDGGASRVGGRPVPLITTILSVQSVNQITLNTPVVQPGSITMNGTLNSNTSVTATSLNPITAGVGLTRNWAITGTNIPVNTTVTATSASTLTLSQAATGSGVQTLTLTAPIEVCFGFDDSTAINAALSLPYAIPDVKDNFLTTQPLVVGGTGCNNIQLPSALIMVALSNNTSHCVTATGLDRTNGVNYLVGIRYLPFKVEFGEIDCCNTGLDGLQLHQSNFSSVRGRITNPFRNALGEFFLVDGHWQEGNLVDITCGRVGLHFHHKVTKSASYQTLGGYRIMGRSCGLNSVFLGINAGTQPDQCGGGIRLYAAGSTVADAGMSQNVWGGQAFCELDGERSVALSFGSDICNSPVTFVDTSASYVIEGAASAAFSNTYRSNTFANMVIEDISQGADARGGFQYYAMTNTVVQSTTVSATSSGPWGQTYANPVMLGSSDNYVRWAQRLSFPGLLLLGDQVAGGAATNFFKAGYRGEPFSAQSGNYTLVATDAGKCVINASGTQTLPQNIFAASDVVTIQAFGGGLSIAAGAGVTMYWYNGATLVTTTPRTLANGAEAKILWQNATTAIISAPSGLT